MFKLFGKEYENIWFTSDEHYGSDRHIFLSQRLDFEEDTIAKKKVLDENNVPTYIKTMMMNSVYGSTVVTPIDKMNTILINRHNLFVGKSDIVFHVGDFGDYSIAEKLNGDHVLVMGNYEEDDMNKNFGGDIQQFKEHILSEYNFIHVCQHINNIGADVVLNEAMQKEIYAVNVTHKPEDCIRNTQDNTPKQIEDGRYYMCLFGHIHEKQKIKRFGINVGVDNNHYYPMSLSSINFYFNAILHHYDENVFM